MLSAYAGFANTKDIMNRAKVDKKVLNIQYLAQINTIQTKGKTMQSSFLTTMYGAKTTSPNKNPNRVMGGLRAHGLNSYTIIAEDGSEQSVASQRYVETLEQKVADQARVIKEMQNQMSKLARDTNNLQNQINTVTRKSIHDNSVSYR